MARTEILGIDRLNLRGGTQPRSRLDQSTVRKYADLYEEEKQTNTIILPPPVVFFDGSEYWLADGFHRWHARRRAGFDTIKVEIRQGDLRDAQLYSFGANADHGLCRSDEDRERVVKKCLANPEWAMKSDRWVAETCRVSAWYIAKVRKVLEREQADKNGAGARASHQEETRTGRNGVAQPVKKKKRVKKEPEVPVDRYGVEIPKKCLAAFQDPWVQETLDFLGRLTETFHKQRLADGLAKRQKVHPQFNLKDWIAGVGMVGDTLDKLCEHLKENRPHAVCPICKGEQCPKCSMTGLVSPSRYGELTEGIDA